MTDSRTPLSGFITATEAAAIIQVSERTLWRYLSGGDPAMPRPVRVRGRVYFDRRAVERWAKGRG